MKNSIVTVVALGAALLTSLSTGCGGAPTLAGASPAGVSSAPGPGSAPGSAPVHFSAPAAQWLYSAPQGQGLDISSIASGLQLNVNAHDGGFDYPVQYTDGSNGCTTFTDTLVYSYSDDVCVPNPAGGYAPSVGGYGYNDGHLVVVNTATGDFYDFWKLSVDGNGQPTSTNVGRVNHGNLQTSNGTPGTTATSITGLAGDILPGELDCETCLNHALLLIVPGGLNSPATGSQAPILGTDGTIPGAIFREGAKLRVDPSLDIDGLNATTAAKAVLRALQLYGGVICDQNGSSTGIGIYSALATTPDLTGAQAGLQHLEIYY